MTGCTAATSVHSGATFAPTPAASPSASPSSSHRAATWFAPFPYAPAWAAPGEAIDGSADFDELFTGPDRWPVASQATDVVKLASGWVEWHATDDQLRSIVDATRARGQLLALEIGSLVGTDACGMDVEGFNATLRPFTRIHSLGGRVAFVAFDEPYAFGHSYAGERSCQWSVQRVAERTAAFVRELRLIEPDVRVGDIEPLWADLTPEALGAWLDAYRSAAGEHFDFFQLDVDWNVADWRAWVAGLATQTRQRGVPLGVIYNAGLETSDQAWTDAARSHIDAVEAVLGGRPEQIIFQSWFHYPRRVLPETDLSTFTGLLRQYVVAQRTAITASSTPGRHIEGRLTSSDGGPVADARVAVSGASLDVGDAEIRTTGTVPPGASTALVGLRVNEEGAGPGAGTFAIYRLSYTEAGRATNLVPDPAFDRPTTAWSIAGDATATFERSDRGAGTMLQVRAAADQTLEVNGSEFRVEPGKAFELVASVKAGLAAAAPQVILVFLDGSEVSRVILPIQPEERDIGIAATGTSGMFGIDVPPGPARVRIRFPGDLDHWPAAVELTLTGG